MAQIELEIERIEKKSYHLILDYGELASIHAMLFYYRDRATDISEGRWSLIEDIFEQIKTVEKL